MPASTSSIPPTCTRPASSEEIVGKALKDRRDDVVLAIKFFMPMGEDPNQRGGS
jgi:aryl-alcohol dehydrogenase-like predicted oxidoreductase